MTDNSTNNKRIAKNTMLLYIRMLFLMLIALYTSRVVLNSLGVVDYGIYNVVGGVVAMFSMLSASLSSAISRFITYELGTGNNEKLKTVFSTAVTIQIGLALILIVIAETVGLWFVNTHLVIPEDRMVAANWVYQLSIFTFSVNLISLPYNAAIIAHEEMSAFAYISIFEALGKLSIAWCIVFSPFDRLIFYAVLVALLAIFIRLLYGWYCKKHFSECEYHFIYDHVIFKQMFSFAGWSFIGTSSGVLRNQGGDILVNVFYGPAVSAARAIATQVNTAVSGFVSNFMTALNPQITKSYASGDHNYMFFLMFHGARISYYILLLLCLPVLFNTNYILTLWLKIVPDHSVLFVQLTLLLAMSESISIPLVTAMLATGRIKNYQIIVGGLQMMNLPISWLCLSLGAKPETIVIVAIIIDQCCLAARLLMLRGMIKLDVRKYLKDVYFKIIVVTILSAIIPFIVGQYMSEGIMRFILITLLALLCTILVEFYVGCTKKERGLVISKVQQFSQQFFNRGYKS